jgi:ACS family hexuronate transporter-like MFS transporter
VTAARARTLLGVLLCASTLLNYLDRLSIGIVSVEIRTQFHMTAQDYGNVLSLFFVAYTIMYAGSGCVLDRLGTRRGFALFLAAWSLAQMLHGFAQGIATLAACRFLLGLAEPGAWPGAAKAVAEWLPPARRALYMGIFNAGTSLGSAAAPVLIAAITLSYGWRSAFIATGLLGFLWLAAWLAFYHPPAQSPWLSPTTRAELIRQLTPTQLLDPPSRNSFTLFFTRPCWSLTLTRFFTDPVIYFAIFWLPEYLRTSRGFNLAMIRNYAWLPFLAGGLGYIGGGWLSGHLIAKGWNLRRARNAGLLAGAAFMPLTMLTPFVPNAALALLTSSFLTIGHGVWVANFQTLPADLYPNHEVGRVMGFSGAGGALGGVLAQTATGWIVTHFSYTPAFLLAGLLHPLSAAFLFRAIRPKHFQS